MPKIASLSIRRCINYIKDNVSEIYSMDIMKIVIKKMGCFLPMNSK